MKNTSESDRLTLIVDIMMKMVKSHADHENDLQCVRDEWQCWMDREWMIEKASTEQQFNIMTTEDKINNKTDLGECAIPVVVVVVNKSL